MVLNMLQESNNNDNTATTTLSSQGSPTPSSPSSFTHEYDTSNYFSRLPNETIFTILAFVITNVSITTTTTTIATASIYPPHKQLAVLSQVCRLFNKIANDALLWQIAFETKFDSEAIIRAGIIDNNVIDKECSFGGYGGTEGEGEGHKIITTQMQNSSSSFVQTGGSIWKELYKERQIALNKIKNYIKP